MFGEIFDASSSQSALWAVILGALLATVGGFVATQMERVVEHRRRERNAALFFGELLTTLQIILRFTKSTHGRGDPYGPITLRMLRSAGKEIEIYDRNRESLFDLRHAHLRARIQTLIIRMTMPIEGVFDASNEISNYRMQLKGEIGAETRAELERRVAELCESRDSGFEFIMDMAAEIPAIVRDLQPLAGHDFRNADQVVAGVNPATFAVDQNQS
ncbi:MAG TPA: hypothetical protein VL971_01625 [Rhizomicrobium sp.]|jgi:hypothetical protein|nr:hypothetical protein [Rhizomicrobium sp.]